VSELPACRSCGATGLRPFLDLGTTPLADNLVPPERAGEPEPRFPLEVAFCPDCTLVQILAEVPPHLLFVDNYLYFSSFSDHLLEHSRQHANGLIESRGLDAHSLVVELASNDGYLLRNFADKGIPVVGVDPAPRQADAAEAIGVPTIREFFGVDLARRMLAEHGPADVIVANNVMAHVPALNDFVGGISLLLADDGVLTVENPYVRDLIDECAFDTIYHEHFCYYSCTAVDRLVRRHGMFLNDVAYFPDLHGGTLRWTIGKSEAVSDTARRYLAEEQANGVTSFEYYADFARRVEHNKSALLDLLREIKAEGGRIAAYGAAAKGSTLVNYVGIDAALVEYVVDRNVHKQGLNMPGVGLPIRPVEALLEDQPEYLLLLAWNFAAEIAAQQSDYRERGGHFIVPVPVPTVMT
jgi:SAM-dependent methyltransferase